MRFLDSAAIGALPLVCLLASGSAVAQPIPGTPYHQARSANTYAPLANPTIIWSSVDDQTRAIALPFPIRFYDTTQTSVAVGSNGAIAFPGTVNVTRFNNAPGSTGAPAGFVAPVWDDLLLGGGAGHIAYQVDGTAPARTITFEWRGVGFYDFAGQIGAMTFAVRFHEGASGRIDVDYGTRSGTFVGSTTMGMENTANGGPILFATRGCTDDCTSADFPENTRISLFQDPGVELLAVDVRPPELAFLGAAARVPVTVQNLHGAAVGPFDVAVVASATRDLANATSMGRTTVTLGAFETRAIDVTAVPPASLGTNPVYVGLVVDPTNAVAEVDEANNTAVSSSRMRLLTGRPDLAVQRVRTSTSRVDAGDTIDVRTTVANLGSDPVVNVEVAIILSTNSVISRQDVTLGGFDVSLLPGEHVEATVTVTVDAGTHSGTYFVGALADPNGVVDELSKSNNGLADIGTLEVRGAALAVATAALPDAFLDARYDAVLTAAGGDPTDRVWSVERGTLPAGLGLTRDGLLYGRPEAEQTQTFTVKVASGGEIATKVLTISVVDPSAPLTIVSRQIASAVVGQEYAFGLIATGGADPSARRWTSAVLPPGISLGTFGVLGGTPSEVGSTTFEVTVTDGVETASRSFVLDVRESPNLLIVPRVLSSARFGEAYVERLEAVGNVGDVVWLVETGRLPPGLTLSTRGEISGTPTKVGQFTVVVGARDTAAGGPATDSNAFEIVVLDDQALEITTIDLPTASVGDGYDARVVANGGLAPYSWVVLEGRLPDGLLARTDDPSGALRISGQASNPGVTNLLVEVTDAQGRTAARAFGLRVEVPTPARPPEPPGCTCVATDRPAPVAILLVLALGVPRMVRRRSGRSDGEPDSSGGHP